ncbi:uncharacterized protein [Lepidochelys kempii]|uniref:uncharacterized protein n=1 Tax=Lepidochelys kempii TaxID=8472 RepID=UPI003C705208
MRLQKEKWKEMHYTPRQLSKKIGVTYSMAQFIVQSYRRPCHAKARQRVTHLQPTPKKQNVTVYKAQCTYYVRTRGRGRELTDSDASLTSCCRAKGKAEEDMHGYDAPLTSNAGGKRGAKNLGDSDVPSLHIYSRSYSRAKSRKEHVSPSTSYSRPCRGRSCVAPPARKAKFSKGRRGRRRQSVKRRKGAQGGRYQRVRKAVPFVPSKQPCQGRGREIPITLLLDVPLNIYLEDEQWTVKGEERQTGKKRRNKGVAVQVPSICTTELVATDGYQTDSSCGQGESRTRQWAADASTTVDESPGERKVPVPEEISCEHGAYPTGGEVPTEISKECTGSGWWERIQNWLLSFGMYLENIIKS